MKKILERGDWLTDAHMTLAQELLKKEFPFLDGLQSSLLSQNNGFIPVCFEAIQIHHVHNHWVTSTSIGQRITVYDSLFWSKIKLIAHSSAGIHIQTPH